MREPKIEVIRERDPMMIRLPQTQLVERMDPGFWDPKWLRLLAKLKKCQFSLALLGNFITFITYGQVGAREYHPKGEVQYITPKNIPPYCTGIDQEGAAVTILHAEGHRRFHV